MPGPEIFTSVINNYLPEPQASLLNGMIFGVELKTTREFINELKNVGLIHIVVLSGMNISLIAAIMSLITSRFSKLISSLITILTVILFIIFVGAKAPIIRAGIMGTLTLVAFIFQRKAVAIYSLLFAGIITVIFFPKWLSSISFQLSYAATLGILLFAKSKPQSSSFSKEFRISLSAQVFTVPIIFFYFRQISLIAPLSNMLVAPLVGPIMIFGLLTAFLGKLHYSLGLIPAFISYGLLSWLVFVVKTLAKIPFASINF